MVADDSKNPTVHVVLKDTPAVKRAEKCSYLMTIGARRNARGGRKRGSYTTSGNGRRKQCPRWATRTIKGAPYCDVHGPAIFRIDPYYQTKAWKALRRATLERDDHRCRYCGLVARQADHVVPRRKGGTDSLENLVACCVSCNKVAGGSVFSSFSEKKRWILSQRTLRKKPKTA